MNVQKKLRFENTQFLVVMGWNKKIPCGSRAAMELWARCGGGGERTQAAASGRTGLTHTEAEMCRVTFRPAKF